MEPNYLFTYNIACKLIKSEINHTNYNLKKNINRLFLQNI